MSGFDQTTLTPRLMTTITMPRELDSAFQQIVDQTKAACVAALAERFGFDAGEAHRFLGGDAGVVKIVKKRGPVPKAKTGKPAKGAKAAAKDEPKRRPTGYLLFSADARPAIRSEMEAELAEEAFAARAAAVPRPAPQAVVKALAAAWKALESEEREAWNELAAAPEEEPPAPPASPIAREAFSGLPLLTATRQTADMADYGFDAGEGLGLLAIGREESVGSDGPSWNEYRLPSEAPRCNHTGMCSCGW